MSEFDARLNECLEALREGRWDIDECLRRNPEHANELRPQLLAALTVARAYAAQPVGRDFAARARERFLLASGERLQQAFGVEPDPSFFAAARMRFLLAAQRLGLGEKHARRRWLPSFHAGFRALGGAMAALVLLLSFSTYTVASANSALPGDWQYPVKLQTEKVRLALAFNDNDKLNIKLDIAEERAHELEQLTKRGRIIGPGVLDRIVEHTQPLVEGASKGDGWDTDDIARLKAVADQEQEALLQASGQVDPDAQDNLEQAAIVSRQAAEVAGRILVARPDAPPQVIKGNEVLAPTATPKPAVAATVQPTAEGSATADAGVPTVAAPTATAGHDVTIDPTPVRERQGIVWSRLAVGRFTTLIPSEANGWHISGIDVAAGGTNTPALIRLSNSDGTSLVTLNPRTGDMYWFIARDGRFDEVQMRLQQAGGEILVQNHEHLTALYGEAAQVPLYILDNIELAPLPTPTPTETPAATPTFAVPAP